MKVALFYAHAASNWGDLAINLGVLKQLEEMGTNLENVHAVRLPHNTIHTMNSDLSLNYLRVVPVEVPADVNPRLGMLAQAYEYLADIEKFIADFEINAVDVILLNSGEHLFENSDGSNVGDIAWRLLPLIAATHAQIPVVQLPATVGPFHTHRGTGLFRYFLSNLSRGAVRDELSEKFLGNFDEPLDRVLDPGFFGVRHFPSKVRVDPHNAVALVPRLEDFGLRAGSRRSAYVLAKNRDKRYEYSKAFQVYLMLAKEILANSSDRIHLIVQTWADRELIDNLYTALAPFDPDSRVWLHDPTDYDTFTDSLAAVDVVVTSRFHSAILALTQGVPAIGIYSDSHGHKMPGLFSMLGIPSNAVRLQDRLPDIVIDEIIKALDYSKSIKDVIYDSVVSWRRISEKWFKNAVRHSTASTEGLAARRQEVDQMRIDLLYGLHNEIVNHVQRDTQKNILAKLNAIEHRLSPS